MSIVECKECGNQVSSKAKSCPNCGAPLKWKTSTFTWLVLFLFIVIIFAKSLEDTKNNQKSTIPDTTPKTTKKKPPFVEREATIKEDCIATMRLSSYEKAMSASINKQNHVVGKMMAEGKVLSIERGTNGVLLEETKVMSRRMTVVRFAYPYNPNGDYGVWVAKTCFD